MVTWPMTQNRPYPRTESTDPECMSSRLMKRQPVSCEICRKRKIRCFGGRTPCDTCVRRGFASSCHYLRERPLTPTASTSRDDELLERMARLEDLLRQHLVPVSTPSYPLDGVDGRSWTETTDLPAQQLKTEAAGAILVSDSGYVRFVPAMHLPDSSVVNQLLEPAASPDVSAGFPFFSDASISRQTLLDSLPPTRQCEELKAVFFEVFSPVSGSNPCRSV